MFYYGEKAIKLFYSSHNNKTKVVYFVKIDCPNEYIKIGVSCKPRVRLKALQTSLPYKAKLLAIFAPKDMQGKNAEYAFHSYFKNKRVIGEWFNISPIDLNLIMTSSFESKLNTIYLKGLPKRKFLAKRAKKIRKAKYRKRRLYRKPK